MRLISLTSNKPSFRSVHFNRTGLSFIVGSMKSRTSTKGNLTKTTNGVGKSLMIEIIHFCLGSKPNKAFKAHLTDWVFNLEIELHDAQHKISRSAGSPSKITLDGISIKQKDLLTWLYQGCFERADGIKVITFRKLIGQFARSGRDAYAHFDRVDTGDRHSPYSAMLRGAFLLGLDLSLAHTKRTLRVRQEFLKKTINQLEKDPLFKHIFEEDRSGVEINSLKEEAAKLDADLKAFRVAENYRAIQDEADEIKRSLENDRRQLSKFTEALEQIRRSSLTRPDLDPNTVLKAYEEAKAALPDLVTKTIHEVTAFWKTLQHQRLSRLNEDKRRIETARDSFAASVEEKASLLELKLQYLGSHIALEEYLAVSSRLSEVRARLSKLEDAQQQREKIIGETRRIELRMIEETIKTEDYLSEMKDALAIADRTFRHNTSELYGQRTSGISVVNDQGENQTRYQINAHIRGDAAEGINEAKIFCYDFTSLELGRRHQVKFLLHDSTLFHPIDIRQRWSMLQLAHHLSSKLNVQYIATLNEQDLYPNATESMQDSHDFGKIVTDKSVVLRLTDNSPEDRLLGIEIDMDYRDSEAHDPDEDGAAE